MKNKNLLQLIKILIIVLSVVILVTGCFPKAAENKDDHGSKPTTENKTQVSPLPKVGQDQPFYDFYNKVAINQTKAEVDSALGVEAVSDTDGSYIYTDPNTDFSVNVIYSASDLVTAKILIPPAGGGEWMKFSTATVTESQVPSIAEGMTYDEVKNILGGEGLELAVMIYPGTKDLVVYVLTWINPDFSSLSVVFDGETGKVLMTEYKI